MAKYLAEMTTPVTAHEAFTYLSRFDNTQEWDPGVVEAEMITPEPVGVGSEFRVVAAFMGREKELVYRITELEPDRRVVLVAETPSIVSEDTITFAEHSDGSSIVTYDAHLSGRGFGALLAPLLSLAFKGIGDRAVEGLQSALGRLASKSGAGA